MNSRFLAVIVPLLLLVMGCKALSEISEGILLNLRTPTPTSTPQPSGTPQTTVRPSATPTPKPTLTPTLIFPTPNWAEPLAFIDAPPGALDEPYIVLNAYDPNIGYNVTQIQGHIDNNGFICAGDRCSLPISGDSVVIIWARSSSGQTSEATSATVRVSREGEKYLVSVEALKPVHLFLDSCAEIWDLEGAQYLRWTRLPISPIQLNTRKSLHYLVGQMIATGAVEASDCPGGGLDPSGAPNGCGLERAGRELIAWQNQFDLNFWLVGKEIGIPPILLKNLADYETQFWPASARNYIEEFGLTQVNELGVDVLLRWDLDFYQDICRTVTANCGNTYYRQPDQIKRMLRGAAIAALNADCPSCAYGLDLVKARKSIETIALITRANCSDVQYVLDANDYTATYEDTWRFTLVAYHSGIQCLQNAVQNVVRTGWEINWTQVSEKLDCPGSAEYVNTIWDSLGRFDENLLHPGDLQVRQVQPTMLPTRTPLPSPTAVVSYAQVRVQVFMDANGDGAAQDGEWLDDIAVQLALTNGKFYTGKTKNGELIIDLTGEPIGIGVTASLPGLYRSLYFELPAQGEIPVVFMFTPPDTPIDLP